MKKFYFLTAALVAASAMSAQKVANIDSERMIKAELVGKTFDKSSLIMNEKFSSIFGGIKAPQKAVADGLYYNRPEGSFYYGITIDGMGYNFSSLVVAPFTEFTFKNMSNNPTSVEWFLNFPILNSTNTAYVGYDERDVTSQADANGNYTASIDPGYYIVMPTIKNGASEFTLCEGNTQWGGKPGLEPKVQLQDTLYSFCGVDFHQGLYYGLQGGAYIFGTMEENDADLGKGISVAVRQYYDKPMSPMFVEQAFIMGVSNSATPLPADKELTLVIINTETGEPTEVLTATADDLIDIQFNSNIKKYQYDIHFSKKVQTPLGEMMAPIVIDYPFVAQIGGFNGEGVDVGLYGNDIVDGDNMKSTEMLFDFSGEVYSLGYKALGLPLNFQALFDKVYVWETAVSQDQQISGVNVVRVSEDGQTCQNNVFSDVNGAIVNTATPWFDNDGGDMYFKAEDTPEWINLVAVYNETVDAYVVSVVCDPLPAGIKGRNAVVYIEGRGVTSETPILVVQGDAEIPSGINNATADRNNYVDANAPVYNLNGQRTTKAAKGLLIQNGKKYLNK